MSSLYAPWIGGAALLGGAAFPFPGRLYVLIGLMLFLPLLDRKWTPPRLPRAKINYLSWCGLLSIAALLLAWEPHRTAFAVSALLLAALPEEWFFRAYFMTRLGQGWRANSVTSVLFALAHGLIHGWVTALLVFAPALIYGWLYQRTRDLPLLILVHALSNLVYIMFIARFLAA